jgi:phosphatidylglycerophosphate synthase
VRALVCPGAAGPDALAAVTQRLARLGLDAVVVLDRAPVADQLEAIAGALDGRTLVVDADLVVADASLGQLVDDPAVRSGALVSPTPPPAPVLGGPSSGGTGASIRVTHRRIGSAGSAVHEVTAANAACLGALVIDARDTADAGPALLDAARAARQHVWQADPVDLALVALVRAQVPMAAVLAVGPVLRGGTAQQRAQVLAELAAIDEARVLLERANRPDDGFYSTFVLRRASKPVTALALRLGLSPNQVSLLSLAVGLAAAAAFAVGTWPALLVGALLLQASLVIDCVDGEVARFTRSFSELGAWLDASTDRVKEYAAYAGLALGSARSGRDIWALAAVVMIMQTVRHVGDYDFSRVQRIRESWVAGRPVADASDGGAAGTGATLALSAQLNRSSRVRWAKKVLHMPIGERWLVLSVGAITVGPRWTLVVLLALGLVALAYTTTGRILRSRSWRHPAARSGSWLLEPQRDLGPLGNPVWGRWVAPGDPLSGAFGWMWPVAMRVVELGIAWLLVVTVAPAAADLLFAWLFVVVFHHYDTLYRALGGSAPPGWLVAAGAGWDGRTLVLLGATALGADVLAPVLGWGSVALGILLVGVASIQWVQSMSRSATGEDVAHA